MRHLFAALAGGLFGAGLLVSGMTDTAKVQGWLDVFGAWDPTLAFVLGGAILPMALAWRLAARRPRPALGACFPERPAGMLDVRLLTGCPGPAIASLGYNGAAGLVFFAAMVVGMLLARAALPTRAVAA